MSSAASNHAATARRLNEAGVLWSASQDACATPDHTEAQNVLHNQAVRLINELEITNTAVTTRIGSLERFLGDLQRVLTAAYVHENYGEDNFQDAVLRVLKPLFVPPFTVQKSFMVSNVALQRLHFVGSFGALILRHCRCTSNGT